MNHTSDVDAQAMIRLYGQLAKLKQLRRQGWIDRGVDDPESVASHSWAVAALAWILARDRDDLDRDRVLLLGLVHDLPEAIAGDATPFDQDRDEAGAVPIDRFHQAPEYTPDRQHAKTDREAAALRDLVAGLSEDLANEVQAAWWEYERAETPEARFVKQVDKLETLLQAEHYQHAQPDLIIESFRLGAVRDVTDPVLQAVLEALQAPDDE